NGQCDWAGPLEMTEIGQGRKGVRGALLTHWKMTTTFLPGILPTVAWLGQLWCKPHEGAAAAQDAMLSQLFPAASLPDRHAIRYAYGGLLWRANSAEIAHRGPLTMEQRRHLYAVQGHRELL